MFQHSKLYPYLSNPSFLFQLAKEQVVELHARLTVLDFHERPIQDITGRIINGNLNVDGQSSVRRTGNLTVFIEHDVLSYMAINGLFALNKKIKIEIGVVNSTNSYTDFPIVWFPQGVFAIINLSSSHTPSGTSITLQVRDKMVFLNGECGGTISATTIFHEYEELDAETGEYIISKPTIIQIIRELVNHFGGEQLGRIFINDLEPRVKKVMRWNQTEPVYLYTHKIHSNLRYLSLIPFRTEDSIVIKDLEKSWEQYEEDYNEIMKTRYPEKPGTAPPYSENFYLDKEKEYKHEKLKKDEKIAKEKERIERESPVKEDLDNFICTVYTKGQDIGYTYSDFYFPDELIANAGDTVCAILDKIKTVLGNYEYFYDINGNFVFQEIKNYLNTTQSTTVLNNLKLIQKLNADRQKYLEDSEELINKLPEGEEKNDARKTQLETLNRFDAQIFNATTASEVRNYLVDRTGGKAMYIFDDSEIVTSFSNSPQYPQIKNDFVVWGMRETVDGKTLPIRYHLAIDNKPSIGNIYRCHFFKDPDAINLSTLEPIEKAGLAIELYEEHGDILPEVGALNRLYVYIKKDGSRYGYYWEPDETKSRQIIDTNELKYLPTFKKLVEEDEYKLQEFPGYIGDEKIEENWNKDEKIEQGEILLRQAEDTKTIIVDTQNYQITVLDGPDGKLDKKTSWETHTKYHPTTEIEIKTTDWRSELYLQGVNASKYGSDSNYYYAELENEWPKLYDLKAIKNENYYEGEWREDILNNSTSLDFFLDFIDSNAAISAFNISSIGRRTKVVVDDKINCLFEPDIPDYVFIDNTAENRDEMLQECADKGQPFITLNSDMYTSLIQGGTYNSAFNLIQDLLYQHTGYNESISLQTLPLYFLEPNIRITVRDEVTGIYGDYMLNSFSMPLDIGGTMSLSCTRALDKI